MSKSLTQKVPSVLEKIANIPVDTIKIRESLTFNKDNIKDISENGVTCNKISIYNNIFNITEDEFAVEALGDVFIGVLHVDGISEIVYVLTNNTDVFEIDGYLDGNIWKMASSPIPLKYSSTVV